MNTAIGIDFGSTYSRGAFWSNNAPEVLRDETHLDSTALLPSAVLKQAQGTVVGWPARRIRTAEDQGPLSLKRQWIGGNAEAAASAALVLKEFKARAGVLLKNTAAKAAFSVPFLWDEVCRGQFEKSAREAGFENLGLIPECAAAALAYAYLKKKNGVAGIYNFGGGLFEFGVVWIQNGDVKLLGAEGLALGGEDLDLCVAQAMFKDMGADGKEAAKSPAIYQCVIQEAEKARCALSHRGSYDVQIAGPPAYSRAFSRFELAKWVREQVEKTVGVCESAMKKAGVLHQDIQEVLLAGGVTRMPCVQETVEKIFRKRAGMEINPDLAVVFGTLIYATIQNKKITDWRLTL
jgi:molecular chaperone DnaK